MDLINIKQADKSEEGIVVELLHPATGEVITDAKGKPFFARIQGQGSKAYRKLVNARLRKMQNDAARRGKAPVKTLEDAERDDAEELAALTLELYVVEDGKKVEQTPAEFQRIYGDYDWIRKQLNEVMRDDAAFFAA